jgi:hypothetical protein
MMLWPWIPGFEFPSLLSPLLQGMVHSSDAGTGDEEQDLICVDPNLSGAIETSEPRHTFILNRSS